MSKRFLGGIKKGIVVSRNGMMDVVMLKKKDISVGRE